MFKRIITALIIIVCSSNAFAKGECVYKTETVSQNGKVITSKETKVCTEQRKFNYGIIDFITDDENEDIIRHNICNVELQPNICDL